MGCQLFLYHIKTLQRNVEAVLTGTDGVPPVSYTHLDVYKRQAIYNEKYYPQKDDGTPVKAHHNHYRRLKWDMPCRTITQNNGVISSLACVHPGRKYVDINGEELYSDARVLTIYELLIVMSLPLNWPIPEWANETFIRRVIGEGIPSKLVKEIMQELLRPVSYTHLCSSGSRKYLLNPFVFNQNQVVELTG